MREGKTMININYFISKTTIYKKFLKKHQNKWDVNIPFG